MKERPILFSTPMVRAILENRKSVTRRIIKPQLEDYRDGYPDGRDCPPMSMVKYKGKWIDDSDFINDYCPYGQVGSRLWCKESYYLFGHWVQKGLTKTGKLRWEFRTEVLGEALYSDCAPDYPQTNRTKRGWFKRSGIFMFKKDSRITLEITDIGIAMAKDITVADAIKEGFGIYDDPVNEFNKLFLKLNPHLGNLLAWVWCISFRRIK